MGQGLGPRTQAVEQNGLLSVDRLEAKKTKGMEGLPPLYSSFSGVRSNSNSYNTVAVPERAADHEPNGGPPPAVPTKAAASTLSRGGASRGGLPRSKSFGNIGPFAGTGSAARRGPTKITTTTEELIAYDRLNARDKELLEKSQVVLGLSKLYELEMGDRGAGRRGASGSRTVALNSAKKGA